MEEQLGKRINIDRVDEALDTLESGPDPMGEKQKIATGCLFCRVMTDGVTAQTSGTEKEDQIEVVDVAQLLLKASAAASRSTWLARGKVRGPGDVEQRRHRSSKKRRPCPSPTPKPAAAPAAAAAPADAKLRAVAGHEGRPRHEGRNGGRRRHGLARRLLAPEAPRRRSTGRREGFGMKGGIGMKGGSASRRSRTGSRSHPR